MATVPWQRSPEVVEARRSTLAILAASQVFGGIGFGAGLSVGILLAEDVTSSEGWAGLARTSTTIGAALLAIPLATVAIRAGRRAALGGGWVLAALGSALLVLAAQPVGQQIATVALVAGMTLAGAGSAVSLQSRFAATDLAEPTRRSRDLSLIVWATTVGSVLGPNLGTPGEALSRALGIAPFAGPFVIAAVMQLVAAGLLFSLRVDPLTLARRFTTTVGAVPTRPRLRQTLHTAWSVPSSRLALIAICAAHTVMVSVMTMTPVHLEHHGFGVTVVGVTISLHVLGMYGLSPVWGAAADRFGRATLLTTGAVVLLCAAAVAGWSGGAAVPVTVGLVLIGLGWSIVMIAASTLLTEAHVEADRARVQGLSDAAMNACAALGAAGSGPLLGLIGFGGLNLIAAFVVVAGGVLAASTGSLRAVRRAPLLG